MPSKSTKPITGRVANETYIQLIKMADREGMTLSQFVGYKLSQLTAPNQTIEQTINAIDNVLRDRPKTKPTYFKKETIPAHVLNPNPLNDFGRVGVDITPESSGYYKEEDVYKLELLLDKKFVYGKWSNHLAIPKNQIKRDGSIFLPINANNIDLLEEFATGNDTFPFMYSRVSNSIPTIDENGEECVTFKGGYEGLRFGTINMFNENGELVFQSRFKWFYRYKDLYGKHENVMIKMIG